jgi:hypothetical protein
MGFFSAFSDLGGIYRRRVDRRETRPRWRSLPFIHLIDLIDLIGLARTGKIRESDRILHPNAYARMENREKGRWVDKVDKIALRPCNNVARVRLAAKVDALGIWVSWIPIGGSLLAKLSQPCIPH